MKIMTLAKLAALGGAAYYVKKHGGIKPAFAQLKESMKSFADQAKPAVESAVTATETGTGLGESRRSGATFGNKTSY